MLSDANDVRLDATVMLMDALLNEVEAGRLRVPAFQRPFVWPPDQMLDLFDSIERGYPIGSLLVWQTDRVYPSLSRIGSVELPDVADGRLISYLLDGHQRVSTLFGTLRRPSSAPSSTAEWKWRIYRDLRPDSPDRYIHHRRDGEPPSHFLPLRAVSRTMDFLAFSRQAELTRLDHGKVSDLIREAEAVAQKIKNYPIPLVKILGGDLDRAVDIYTRLNRKGIRIESDQLVSALAYHDNKQTLSDRIDDIVTGVAEIGLTEPEPESQANPTSLMDLLNPTGPRRPEPATSRVGFGPIPRAVVFRTLLAVAGEADVMSPRWEAVASRLGPKLDDAVPAADDALRRAVRFLKLDVGLRVAKLLPYAHQLTLLACFFHAQPSPTVEQLLALNRWFWITSWTDAYASANTTIVRRSLANMKDFATGRADLHIQDDNVQPVPETFNLNSARTRAYLTWELIEFPTRLAPSGITFDAVKAVAAGDSLSQIYRPVVDGDSRPANRLILPTPPRMSARKALTDLWAYDHGRVLQSHGIPKAAYDRLVEGDGDGFVAARAAYLNERILEFAGSLDIPLLPDLEGDSDDDTE
ncbi:DUF262 domain-containing protein [Hamadaea sp. NPDC051192]|uniref:DUF262 domain-containing protein n=1 Tax=Hamadaea sp. NPDC051192 TaxID=3154940 RepID=UPI00344673B0